MSEDVFSKIVNQSKKIAILVPYFAEFSGDARVAELQAKELVEIGKEVVIFTLTKEISVAIEIINMGMPKSLFWQRIYRLLFPLDLIKTFRFLPKLKEFDLIISHLYPMNWLAFLAKKFYGVKYVYWYHGIPYPELQPYLYERLYLKMFIWMTKITTKNADLIVSVSKSAREEVKDYTGLNSIVIYNKPDVSRFYESIDGSKIREKLNLWKDPVILNVGRVCPQKGAHLLIDAFKLIKQDIQNARLVIVGKHTYDYYSRELKEMADNSEIFVGFVSDKELPYYYAACDVYATCSLWEAHNVPVIEAQACGKPVVAFDFDFFKEEVDENGILVKKGDVNMFANACIRKLREVRGDLIE